MTDRIVSSGSTKLTDLAWIRALYELGQTAANGADPFRVRQDIFNHIVEGSTRKADRSR